MKLILSILLMSAIAAVGTGAFSVLYRIKKEHYGICCLTGGICWAVYLILTNLGVTRGIAYFFASATVCLSARILSVRRECPVIVFLLPGIFPLVPGVTGFSTIYQYISNDLANIQENVRSTLGSAIAIVLGILFVFAIPQKVFHLFSHKVQK
jgi:uncharacterized membrane protein YjjB (DUF3815 family)